MIRISLFQPSSHIMCPRSSNWNHSQSKGDRGGGGNKPIIGALDQFPQIMYTATPQVNEWDFDSASALNRFDHHGYSRASIMEQFLKERQKQQVEDFDYDLKFLPYSAQARSILGSWPQHP